MVYTHIFRLTDEGTSVGIKLSTELIDLLTAFKEKFGKDCYNELINSFSKDFEDIYLGNSLELYNTEEYGSISYLRVTLKEANNVEKNVKDWFIRNSREDLWISDRQIEEWNSVDISTREAIIQFQSEVFEKPDSVNQENWDNLTQLERHNLLFQISQNKDELDDDLKL